MRVSTGSPPLEYDATGGETGRGASASRRRCGHAADVYFDNDGDGRMDDLNGGGRIEHRNARVILDAADARGYRARWGRI